MEVVDNTRDVEFREVGTGQCFVYYVSYYMKIRISEYDYYTGDYKYKYLALDLCSGLSQEMKSDEKVRLVKTKLIVG